MGIYLEFAEQMGLLSSRLRSFFVDMAALREVVCYSCPWQQQHSNGKKHAEYFLWPLEQDTFWQEIDTLDPMPDPVPDPVPCQNVVFPNSSGDHQGARTPVPGGAAYVPTGFWVVLLNSHVTTAGKVQMHSAKQPTISKSGWMDA